ncbi:MAG TPA: glycosyltransferase [Anaeromyxobacter sp.]|nr:glycosyltransferase [Anaeromyxobacter sp.]
MRVALVGNWPRPYGGVAVHVAALAAALRRRGADVLVLDIGRGDHAGPGLRPARGPLRYARGLLAAAAEERLVHLHTSGANRKSWLVAFAAGHARRPAAPPGVLTLHSGSAPSFLRAAFAHRTLAKAACAGFGTVVAVNEEIAAALARAGVLHPRVVVLPAFSPELLEPGDPPPALGPFRAAHAPLLAAALAPEPVYGAELLAAAFRLLRERFPRAGLVVFGAGTDAPAWSGPGQLGMGEIGHGAALALLAQVDVFARPTLADGDALSVREALAAGCVVVASRVGHRPPGCLTFPPGDLPALTARLAEAVTLEHRPPPTPPADAFQALFDIYRAHTFRPAPPRRWRPSPPVARL